MKIESQMVEISLPDESKLNAYLAKPKQSKKNGAAILVFQEIFGVNAHIRSVCERLAEEGYIALAPDLFHRTNPNFQISYQEIATGRQAAEKMTPQGLASDLFGTHSWLKSAFDIEDSKIGSIGFCLGGRVAFIVNATIPLKAAVCFYGGRIAPDHLPEASKQHGPLLFFWGARDPYIPEEQREAVKTALQKAGKKFESVEYTDADHGFFCDDRASFHPAAARESWKTTLAFYRKELLQP